MIIVQCNYFQEPEMAVETYEQAMKHSSGNPKLSRRLGHVLVCTHQYGKAIKCYRDAGKSVFCCKYKT